MWASIFFPLTSLLSLVLVYNFTIRPFMIASFIVCWPRFFYLSLSNIHTYTLFISCFVYVFVASPNSCRWVFFFMYMLMLMLMMYWVRAFFFLAFVAFSNVDCRGRIDVCPSKIWFQRRCFCLNSFPTYIWCCVVLFVYNVCVRGCRSFLFCQMYINVETVFSLLCVFSLFAYAHTA